MTLDWAGLPGGGELAMGDDWTYLIAADDRNVVLTRWDNSVIFGAACRQAALNAISLGGAYETVPEAAAGVITHLKTAAQQYESGLGVPGYPAWRH